MEVHDRELTMLRQGLDGLRDRIDGVKGAMLGALEAHTTDEIKRFQEISDTGSELRAKLDGLRNWILALFIGAGAVFAILEFLVRSGMLIHG